MQQQRCLRAPGEQNVWTTCPRYSGDAVSHCQSMWLFLRHRKIVSPQLFEKELSESSYVCSKPIWVYFARVPHFCSFKGRPKAKHEFGVPSKIQTHTHMLKGQRNIGAWKLGNLRLCPAFRPPASSASPSSVSRVEISQNRETHEMGVFRCFPWPQKPVPSQHLL